MSSIAGVGPGGHHDDLARGQAFTLVEGLGLRHFRVQLVGDQRALGGKATIRAVAFDCDLIAVLHLGEGRDALFGENHAGRFDALGVSQGEAELRLALRGGRSDESGDETFDDSHWRDLSFFAGSGSDARLPAAPSLVRC
jgi:hypothetical protein